LILVCLGSCSDAGSGGDGIGRPGGGHGTDDAEMNRGPGDAGGPVTDGVDMGDAKPPGNGLGDAGFGVPDAGEGVGGPPPDTGTDAAQISRGGDDSGLDNGGGGGARCLMTWPEAFLLTDGSPEGIPLIDLNNMLLTTVEDGGAYISVGLRAHSLAPTWQTTIRAQLGREVVAETTFDAPASVCSPDGDFIVSDLRLSTDPFFDPDDLVGQELVLTATMWDTQEERMMLIVEATVILTY